MKAVNGDAGSDIPAIEFSNVSLSFGGTPALEDVSFTLRRGQMIAITGASLSGKSVLLHLAIGLLAADRGDIRIEGQAIASLDEGELLELRSSSMGMTFQEDTLFSSLTVYENAAYRLTEHGWSDADTERAVSEILRFVGLEGEMEKLPEELSVGMRRRLEIARSLVGWPPIMLFDEPTCGLDPITERQVLDLIIRARDVHNIASLYVTKELREIPYLATHAAVKDASGTVSVRKRDADLSGQMKVLVLEDRRIAFFGDPAEFEKSSLPAVSRLTRSASGTYGSGSYVADPWSQLRKAGTDLRRR